MSERMSENKADKPIDLGIYGRGGSGGITAAEIIAIVLSVIWIAWPHTSIPIKACVFRPMPTSI